MLKVTGRIMPAALGFLPSTVFAAEVAGAGEEAAAAPLSLDSLSLYSAPRQTSRSAEPEAGRLEETVAAVRSSAAPYAARCQETFARIKPKLERLVRFGSDAVAYLQNPPKDFYPRAGIIGSAGVLGAFLGRGSRVKKLVYPAALVTVSASLYYPEQAAAIAKSAGDSVYECAVQSYAAAEKMVSRPRGGEKDREAGSKA